VECKWGDAGLDDIMQDSSITAVAVVLAGQFQVSLFLVFVEFYVFLFMSSLESTPVLGCHCVSGFANFRGQSSSVQLIHSDY